MAGKTQASLVKIAAKDDELETIQQGYYIAFGNTGSKAIDRILSSVGCAAKAFHHTEMWADEGQSPTFKWMRGNTYAEFIQHAAEDAANMIKALRNRITELETHALLEQEKRRCCMS